MLPSVGVKERKVEVDGLPIRYLVGDTSPPAAARPRLQRPRLRAGHARPSGFRSRPGPARLPQAAPQTRLPQALRRC